jgi:hypothetical protein
VRPQTDRPPKQSANLLQPALRFLAKLERVSLTVLTAELFDRRVKSLQGAPGHVAGLHPLKQLSRLPRRTVEPAPERHTTSVTQSTYRRIGSAD